VWSCFHWRVSFVLVASYFIVLCFSPTVVFADDDPFSEDGPTILELYTAPNTPRLEQFDRKGQPLERLPISQVLRFFPSRIDYLPHDLPKTAIRTCIFRC
jgi:hypothetical protein